MAGSVSLLGVLLACGGSQPQQQSPGVTNEQPAPAIAPYVGPSREGQCLSKGDACSYNVECCSEWCVNDHCAIRQP
jgi:hypothetical protein